MERFSNAGDVPHEESVGMTADRDDPNVIPGQYPVDNLHPIGYEEFPGSPSPSNVNLPGERVSPEDTTPFWDDSAG